MAAGVIEPDGDTYVVTSWQEHLTHAFRDHEEDDESFEDDDEFTSDMYN